MKRRKSSSSLLAAWLLCAALVAWVGGKGAAAHSDDDYGHTGKPSPILRKTTAGVAIRADRELCFSACQLALREPQFTDLEPGATFLTKECHSKLMQTSLYLCIHGYCESDLELTGLVRLNQTCTTYVQSPLPPFERILAAYPDDTIALLRRLQRNEATPTTNLSEVVVLSEQLYENAYDTLDDLNYVRRHHFRYAGIMLLFWLFVVTFGVCGRLLFAVKHTFWRRKTITTGAGYQPLAGDVTEGLDGDDMAVLKRAAVRASSPHLWLKRYLILPATFGHKCSQDFGWYTVPPRIQSLTITIFVVINIATCCIGYKVFTGNMYWPTVSQQLYRYVSDRTGIISFVNFPLIWLFGMRNNILMWLTGWDFGTYNNFHRWVARVATAEAIVHSIGYTVLVCEDGGWASFVEWWARFFWWTGELATVFMSLLLGLSVFWIRRRMYEVFLISHIALSVSVLAGMLGHVSIFKHRYDGFIWICSIIWVFDRVLRGLRIFAFNPLFWNTRAKATYNPRSNVVRLVVPYASSWYQPKPGTYYYIHVLNDKRFWESHPFTVASVASRKSKQYSQAQVELTDHTDVQSEHGTQHGPNEASVLLDGAHVSSSYFADGTHIRLSTPLAGTPSPAHAASSMTFLIRPYDSFTARLRDKAAAAPSRSPASLRVLIDGPYGQSPDFDDFDSVLFVVGGSGVVVPLSYLSGSALPRAATAAATTSRLRSIHIVWAVREAAFAADVLCEDLQDVLGTGRVSLDIYITQSQAYVAETNENDGDNASFANGNDETQILQDRLKDAPPFDEPLPRSVRILYERPDVRGEVECAAKSAEGRGRVAVVACGPGRMADEARRSVVEVLGAQEVGDIEYFEESFRW